MWMLAIQIILKAKSLLTFGNAQMVWSLIKNPFVFIPLIVLVVFLIGDRRGFNRAFEKAERAAEIRREKQEKNDAAQVKSDAIEAELLRKMVNELENQAARQGDNIIVWDKPVTNVLRRAANN